MSGSDPSLNLSVRDNPEALRYEVAVDGVVSGRLEYLLHDDRVVFTHAEVDPRWEGQGVGSVLAKTALDDVIAKGKQITPLCPFIVDYLHRHPEYVDHVDEKHRGEFRRDGG
jgi:predicted GNAT family acetyltransferase